MSTPTQSLSAKISDDRAEILLYEVLKQSTEARSGFLDGECGSDSRLRAEVEGLLQDHERAGGFLKSDAPLSEELAEEFARLKPEDGGDRIGPYKLLELIGEGGFGRVWVAEQERPIRRLVALKIIKLGMDTREVIARFEQERQALAMMEHPNIARVLDAGATPLGRPFFAMELVRGVKITEYCDHAELPTEERLRLFIQVCSAVQHAHQKGIIHRDLKPSNILISLHDGVPVPKVIDFGVAKATQRQRLTDLTVYTQLEQMIGTPLYMSPEQAELSGLDIDTRSDIYSLGVLLYELLAGRTPFDSEQLMKTGLDEMRRVIREEIPQKPSTLLSTMALDGRTTVAKNRRSDAAKLISAIRGDLDWVVMKALEKDRSRRYETANGLANDVQRHLSNEPVLARPPSNLYRFQRLLRRHKSTFAAAGVIVFVLIGGVIGIVWQALRADSEATRANAALAKLRSSAPAFAAQARTMVVKEDFPQAIEKLDIAITLRPDVAEYLISKADLLESQQLFAEAAEAYRAVLRLDSANARAERDAALCDKLALEVEVGKKLSRPSLAELLAAMNSEHRSAAEMLPIAKLLGEEKKLLLSYWIDRLKEAPIPPDISLEKALSFDQNGGLMLDLSKTSIADLSPFEGMPLATLDLSACKKFTDARSISKLPLREINLSHTGVEDLTPLGAIKTLAVVDVSFTPVSDLTPLGALALRWLNVENTVVGDLSPLNGMPLNTLILCHTRVAVLSPVQGMRLTQLELLDTNVVDLRPLAGMPLKVLDCSMTKITDFSPLAGAPIEMLFLKDSLVTDLSFIRGMPLKNLSLPDANHVKNLRVLAEIPTLEVIWLPEQLDDAELSAIEVLRDHPTLRQLQFGDHISIPYTFTAMPREAFWAEYDERIRVFKASTLACEMARKGSFAEAANILRQQSLKRFQDWAALGLVLYAAGDLKGYEEVCREMTGRFPALREAGAVVGRLCLLSPNPGFTPSEVRKYLPHYAQIGEKYLYRSSYLLANGLLEYRLGRHDEAIVLLEKMRGNDDMVAAIIARTGLAMAKGRLGNVKEAKAELTDARKELASHWPGGTEQVRNWSDWLYADLLIKEAEKVLMNGEEVGGANTGTK